jgi:hypothetical protein
MDTNCETWLTTSASIPRLISSWSFRINAKRTQIVRFCKESEAGGQLRFADKPEADINSEVSVSASETTEIRDPCDKFETERNCEVTFPGDPQTSFRWGTMNSIGEILTSNNIYAPITIAIKLCCCLWNVTRGCPHDVYVTEWVVLKRLRVIASSTGQAILIEIFYTYDGVTKSFRTESITK